MKISDIRASSSVWPKGWITSGHTPGLMPRWTLLPAVPSTTMTERGFAYRAGDQLLRHDCRI